jgi:hypothetical protein
MANDRDKVIVARGPGAATNFCSKSNRILLQPAKVGNRCLGASFRIVRHAQIRQRDVIPDQNPTEFG